MGRYTPRYNPSPESYPCLKYLHYFVGIIHFYSQHYSQHVHPNVKS